MNAVAAGIGHVAVRLDLEHKSSSVPSGAHTTPGTGHKATDTGKSLVCDADEDVDDVFHEVLKSSGHFDPSDLTTDMQLSGAFLEHHLPGEHHFTSPTSFKLPDHDAGHYDAGFSLFGEGAHHLAPEPMFSASNEAFSIPGHLPGERRLYDKVAISFNDDKHTFAITDTTTFGELVKEALHYWGLTSGALKFELHDDQGEPYAISAQVQRTLAAQPPRTPHWIPVLSLGEKKKKKRKMKETDPSKKTIKKTKKPKDKDVQALANGAKTGDTSNGAPAQPADASAKPAAATAAVPKAALVAKAMAKAQPKGAEAAKAVPMRSPQKILSSSAGPVMVGVAPGAVRTIKPGDLSVSTPMEVDTPNSATVPIPKPAAAKQPTQIMYANGGQQIALYKGPAQVATTQVPPPTQNLPLTSLPQQQALAQRAQQVMRQQAQKPAAPTAGTGQQLPLYDASKAAAAAKPVAPGTNIQSASAAQQQQVGAPLQPGAAQSATVVQGQQSVQQASQMQAQHVAPAHVYAVQQQARMTAHPGATSFPVTAAGAPPTAAMPKMLYSSKPAPRVNKPAATMVRTPTGVALPPGAVAQTSGPVSITSSISMSPLPKQPAPPPQQGTSSFPLGTLKTVAISSPPLARTVVPATALSPASLSQAPVYAPSSVTSVVVSSDGTVPKPTIAPASKLMLQPTVRTDAKLPGSGSTISTPSAMTNTSVASTSISPSMIQGPNSTTASNAVIAATQALQAALPHRNPSAAAAPPVQASRAPSSSSVNAVALSAALAATAVGRLPAGASNASLLPPSGATSATGAAAQAAPSSQPPNNSPPQAPGAQQ